MVDVFDLDVLEWGCHGIPPDPMKARDQGGKSPEMLA
jgi:hypothetical protein